MRKLSVTGVNSKYGGLLGMLAAVAAAYAIFVVRGRYLPRIFVPAPWIRALCVAGLVFAIARNLPTYPFPLLAPGGLLGSH